MADPSKTLGQAILATQLDKKPERMEVLFGWIFGDEQPYHIYSVINDMFDVLMRKHSFLIDPEYNLSLLWIEPDDSENYLAVETVLNVLWKTTDQDKALERMAHSGIKKRQNGFWAIWGEESSSRHTALNDLLLDYFMEVFDTTTRASQKLANVMRDVPYVLLVDAAKKLAGKSGGPENIGEFVDIAKRGMK